MLMNKFQYGIPLLSSLDQFMFRLPIRFTLCFTKDKLRPIGGGHFQNVRPNLGTTRSEAPYFLPLSRALSYTIHKMDLSNGNVLNY
jgi:hypothetical protein